MLGQSGATVNLNIVLELFENVVKLSAGLGVRELEELAVAVNRGLDGALENTVQLARPGIDICMSERSTSVAHLLSKR